MASKIPFTKRDLRQLAQSIENSQHTPVPLEGQAVTAKIKEIFHFPNCEVDTQAWAALNLKLRQKRAEVLSTLPRCFQDTAEILLDETTKRYSRVCRLNHLLKHLLEAHEAFVAEVDKKEQTISDLQAAIDRRSGNKSKRTNKQKEFTAEVSRITTKNDRFGSLYLRADREILISSRLCNQATKRMPLLPAFMPLIEDIEEVRVKFFMSNEQMELLFDNDVQVYFDKAIESIPQEKATIDQSCLKRVFCCACRIWSILYPKS